jgi:hypothetical protein
MSRTSRLRRLHVVEPSPDPHEPPNPPAQELPAQEPSVNDGDPDIDARSTGMVMLLRTALRLMKSKQ